MNLTPDKQFSIAAQILEENKVETGKMPCTIIEEGDSDLKSLHLNKLIVTEKVEAELETARGALNLALQYQDLNSAKVIMKMIIKFTDHLDSLK